MEETIAFQRGNGNHGLQKAALACGILPSPDGLRPKLIVTKTKFASGENLSLTDLPDTWPRFVSFKSRFLHVLAASLKSSSSL